MRILSSLSTSKNHRIISISSWSTVREGIFRNTSGRGRDCLSLKLSRYFHRSCEESQLCTSSRQSIAISSQPIFFSKTAKLKSQILVWPANSPKMRCCKHSQGLLYIWHLKFLKGGTTMRRLIFTVQVPYCMRCCMEWYLSRGVILRV